MQAFNFYFYFYVYFFIFYFLFFIFFFLHIFFPVFMNLLVKVYMKRHDRHDKTLKTTHFFNSVFCLVSCSSKNQVPYFILNKVVTDSNLKRLLLMKKQTNKQNKKEKEKEKPTFRSGLPGFSRDIDFFFFSHTKKLIFCISYIIVCQVTGRNKIYQNRVAYTYTILRSPLLVYI